MFFELQQSFIRSWTDLAQTYCKVGMETATAMQRVAAALVGVQPQALTSNPLGAWGFPWMAAPSTMPGFAMPFGWMGTSPLFAPWLSMLGTKSAPFGGPFAVWMMPFMGATASGSPLTQMAPWMNGLAGYPLWPVAGRAETGWPLMQCAQTAPMATWQWALGKSWSSAPWLNPTLMQWMWEQPLNMMKMAASPTDDRRGSTVSRDDRRTVSSYRTAGGHASAAVILQPLDLARSMASFWTMNGDAGSRKPH